MNSTIPYWSNTTPVQLQKPSLILFEAIVCEIPPSIYQAQIIITQYKFSVYQQIYLNIYLYTAYMYLFVKHNEKS